MTRKEAQKIAKEARAREEAARKAVADAEAALQAVQAKLYDARRLAANAENEAAAVPPGSIVYVPIQFHIGSARYGTWVQAGHYEAGTDDGDVRIKTQGGRVTVPRGRYHVVWTPWMGTPKPDLDVLNGKASSNERGAE